MKKPGIIKWAYCLDGRVVPRHKAKKYLIRCVGTLAHCRAIKRMDESSVPSLVVLPSPLADWADGDEIFR